MAEYRVFKGTDTKQVDAISGAPARPDQWYFEPTDYEGDVLWSSGFDEAEDARQEAMTEAHSAEQVES
jgi:hypothetical protein